MQFKTYFFNLPKSNRGAFAALAGTTAGHLTNFAYGYTSLAAEVCVAIERITKGVVSVEELDEKQSWLRVPDSDWPHPGGRPLLDFSAPDVPAQEGQAANA